MKNNLFALLSFLLLFSAKTSFSQELQNLKVEEMFTAFNEYCPMQVGELFYIDSIVFKNKNLIYSLSERKSGIFDVDSSAIKEIACDFLVHMGAPSIFLLAAGYGIIIDLNKGEKTERITLLPQELKEKVTEASKRTSTIEVPELYPSLESHVKEINSSCPVPLTEELEMTSMTLGEILTIQISVTEKGTEKTKLDEIGESLRDYQYRALGYISAVAAQDEHMKYFFGKIKEKDLLINIIFKGKNTGRFAVMKIQGSNLIFIDTQNN